MWCEQCQTDVATQVAADGQSLLCTSCRQPVRKNYVPSLHPETRSAREFLERWAREQESTRQESPQSGESATQSALDNASVENDASARSARRVETTAAAEAGPNNPEQGTDPQTSDETVETHSAVVDNETTSVPPRSDAGTENPQSSSKKQKWRIDGEHGSPSGPIPTPAHRPRRPRMLEKVAQPIPEHAEPEKPGDDDDDTDVLPPRSPDKQKRKTRVDTAHVAAGPHYEVTAPPRKSIFPGRAEAIWGQLLAYGGVGLLTVGSVMVLWGYFGAIERYASTGWLLSTAGQMLLLLGIVTLVSGGMQQTTHEVSQRIDHLGGRIIRIEESTDKILKGPHFQESRRRRRTPAEDQEAA